MLTQTNLAGQVIPELEHDRIRREQNETPTETLPVNTQRNAAGELIPVLPTDPDYITPTE
jgi:hypothetical protein